MKLFALLIGINDYPAKPLTQCVDDAGKIETYLNKISPSYEKVVIEKLLNEKATRKNIIHSIQNFLGQATDEDVAMIYYSGHGALEETAGRFPDEEDGLLECIACYSAVNISTDQFLADKEIRYLLSQLKNNPHLITIFDSCHSGDIVRAYSEEEDSTLMVRRIAGSFDAREYSSFVFADDTTIEKPGQDGKKQIEIPLKNHVNLSACLSSESSWEDSKGGVFTRYLLNLVERTEGNLTYLDIARWAKISLKNVTKANQTPVITTQGDGKMNAYNSWLNLHPEGVTFPEGFITNNAKKGWIFSRGSLLGIRPDMEVIVTLKNGESITAKVKEAGLEESTLTFINNADRALDLKEPRYLARTAYDTYSTLHLYINEIDPDDFTRKVLTDILSEFTNVKLSQAGDADFYLNIFNQFVYFSLPEHDFQPLARQISITPADKIKAQLKEQIIAFIKWHHFFSLENPGQDFDKCPIQVTLQYNQTVAADVTEGTIRLEPLNERNASGEPCQEMKIEVKNTSTEIIYVAVLTLGSDLGISSNPFYGNVVELAPGKSKKFYDKPGDDATASLDQYKEIYNWKEEWFYYKFIFTNSKELSTSIQTNDFLQPALPSPLIYYPNGDPGTNRSEGSKLKEEKKKWGTCRTRIELANPSFNIPSGDLLKYAEEYGNSDLLAPFIKELYFEDIGGSKDKKLQLKQNKNQTAAEATASRATDNALVILMNFIYKSSRRRKFLNKKHTTGPVVIAEGDSWFLFPKPGVRDTLDYIMDKYHVLSLAEAGDEIKDYLKSGELLEEVKKHAPKYVLISGGGNDILGEEVRDILIKDVQNGNEAKDFINLIAFQEKLDFLKNGYVYFLVETVNLQPDVTVFIHGYDYIRSNPDERTIKKGWANRYMIEAGIHDPALRKKIIYFLVDSFNDLLKNLARDYPHVKYIDNRSTVAENEWMDEIHPNNTGFEKVANHFLASMT